MESDAPALGCRGLEHSGWLQLFARCCAWPIFLIGQCGDDPAADLPISGTKPPGGERAVNLILRAGQCRLPIS